jgi:hypothetical protein
VKATWSIRCGVLIALLVHLPSAAAAATLTGAVKDLGRPGEPGVSGVLVWVYPQAPAGAGFLVTRAPAAGGVSGGVRIAGCRTKAATGWAGVTDRTGVYRIDNVPVGVKLQLVFDRSDYQQRCKTIDAELTNSPTTLADVLLKENTDDAGYNARVADTLAQHAAKGQYDAFGLLQDESVPAAQRLALRAALEQRMTKVSLDLAVAKFTAAKPRSLIYVARPKAFGKVDGVKANSISPPGND